MLHKFGLCAKQLSLESFNVIYPPTEKGFKVKNIPDCLEFLIRYNVSNEKSMLTDGNGKVTKFQNSTLVLAGDSDALAKKEDTYKWKTYLGDKAKFVELKNCGHYPPYEQLADTAREIKEFLKAWLLEYWE